MNRFPSDSRESIPGDGRDRRDPSWARRSLLVFCVGILLAEGAGEATAKPLELPPVVPPRQIEQQATSSPAWKVTWDKARQAARRGEYAGAVALYEALLAQRPNIEEARWELAKVYIQQQQWQKAGGLLELLRDQEPDRLDYLDALGEATLEQAHWGRAIELFGKVLAAAPEDAVARSGMVRGLLALGREAEALPHLEAVYRQEPDNRSLRLELARLAYKLGHYEQARPHLVALAAAADASSEILLMTARLCEKLGLGNLAVDYWQRLLKKIPDQEEAHQRLADFYVKSGHFQDALPHLLALKRLHPQDASLLLRIGKGLAASARPQEALPYLNRYVALRPDDIEALELLVNIYSGMGEKTEVLANLERFFSVDDRPDPGKLKQAARLYDAAGRFSDAVTAYRRYFATTGKRDPVAETAMADDLQKLAVHGLSAELEKFGLQGPPAAVMDQDSYQMMMAEAFAAGGSYQRALTEYRQVAATDNGQALQARLAMADIYQGAGLFYEAEQVLRQLLCEEKQDSRILLRLFRVALAAGELDDAETWLEAYAAIVDTKSAWRARLGRAELLAANGVYDDALQSGRRLLATLPAGGGQDGHEKARAEVGLAVARFAIDAGAYETARLQLAGMVGDEGSLSLAPLVLQERLYLLTDEPAKADGVLLRALSEADRTDDGLLRLAELYRRQGMATAMLKVTTLAKQRLSGTLRALLLQAEALVTANEVARAVTLLRQLVADFPDESRATTLLARLLYDHGRFAEALDLVEKVQDGQGGRADLLLIKARCLWGLHRGPEALDSYRSFLEPSVAVTLASEIKDKGLSSPPLIEPPSFWQIVSLRGDAPAGFLDTLMAASHVADRARDSNSLGLNRLAAGYYARYRWQQRFGLEYSARRAEQNKEYLYAVSQYQTLLRLEPDNGALLFDLAGIYRRLGWQGDEAAVYERLAEQQAGFPGLAEATERNRLKRRPRTSLSYGHEQEEGWDGYKAIRRDWQKVSLWMAPRSRHELDLSVSRRHYSATDGSSSACSSRALLSYRAGFSSWLSGRVAAGIERPDDGGVAQTGLLQGELTGKLGDKAVTHLTYEREPVIDTTASFSRNVVRETVSAGGGLDLLPRLQVGGDYGYTDFSDNNRATGYNLWGAYLLFTEPYYLQFRYTYDFKDTKEGHQEGALAADGFAVNDHPYWTPQNYWVNRFSLLFRYQLPEETLDRGWSSYYTAKYSVDYDSTGHQLQTVSGGVSVEWSTHFLVEAAAALTSSGEYRQRDISLSLVYRW